MWDTTTQSFYFSNLNWADANHCILKLDEFVTQKLQAMYLIEFLADVLKNPKERNLL